MGLRALWRSACLFASLLAATASPAAGDDLDHRVKARRDAFVAAVRHCGVEPKFVPAVQLLSTPAVISYDGNKRTLLIGRWESLPPPIQSFFAQWAAKDFPGQTPEHLFDTLFNGFLVGHELGHWASDQSGRLSTLDHYDAEIEANRFCHRLFRFEPRPRDG